MIEAGSGPAAPPPAPRDTRRELAEEFLRGEGIEIGALHLRMALPPGAQVRYVDRMTVPDLRAHYPELEGWDLAPVDIVDDGELLTTIPPESVDFIIANHFLEHCEDPIRTIETHLGKLRPGGVLFYAVPDKRYTFDFRRPRTPLSHVIADHESGPERSRSDHYLEWVRLVYEGHQAPDEDAARQRAAQLEAEGYSIHFHVWTQADLMELMVHCRERFDNFEIEAVRRRSLEVIFVLRKHGEPPHEPPAPADSTAALATPDSGGRAPDGAAASTPTAGALARIRRRLRLPLAGLRMRLDAGSVAADWVVDPDGLHGRVLLQSAPSLVTVPVRLNGPARLSADVRLLPHDWRDGRAAVRARVASVDADGSRKELWTGTIDTASQQRGEPAGIHVECEVPSTCASLHFDVDRSGPSTPGAVARVAWVEPALSLVPDDWPADAVTPAISAPEASPGPPPARRPVISILTPVHDPPLHMLDEAVGSVLGQTADNWELCLVDDGSRNPEVIGALQRYTERDPRIRVHRREQAGGISAATNDALRMAEGEYIALLDHDDTLAPDAIERVTERIAADPRLDMLYSDEDIVLNGRPVWVHLKPAWSPDTLRTNGYTCHLGVYRRSLVEEVGGFRSEFDGSQDVDMILRLVERTDRIAHIPHILYHWRVHASSTAGGDAKPYAYVAARNAIAAHLERVGVSAAVEFGPPGLYRVVHDVEPSTSVALVLAVTDERGLREAAPSWVGQPHASWEVVLAAPADRLAACLDILRAAGVRESRITGVATTAAAPAALATAARAARADQLLIMQAPALGLTQGWLTRLIGYAAQPGVGAAGPIVVAGDGRIHEAGVALPDGLPLFLLHGLRSSMDDFFGFGTSVHNVSAVSGILATRRGVFERLGGLRPEMGSLALVDYCLRARDAGLRVVTIPDARLQTTGPDPTTNDLPDIWALRRQWLQRTSTDPYYNPNYRVDRGDFQRRSTLEAAAT